MPNLTAKQESFIRLMTESDELARRGFDLLMKRVLSISKPSSMRLMTLVCSPQSATLRQ